MLGQNNYFLLETFGSAHPDYHSQMFIDYEAGIHQYLKFVIQDYDEVVDYMSGRIPDPTTLYYGWAEYVVDEDGAFRILNSAIDLDGDAITVGAIPEPTSGLLLLCGAAVLLLKHTGTRHKTPGRNGKI